MLKLLLSFRLTRIWFDMSKFSRLFRQLNTFDRSRKFSFFPKMTRACPELSRLDSLTLAFCRRKLCSSWKCRQHSGSTAAAAIHTCDECKLSWHVIFTSPIFESDMNPYLMSVVTPKMPTRTTTLCAHSLFRSKMASSNLHSDKNSFTMHVHHHHSSALQEYKKVQFGDVTLLFWPEKQNEKLLHYLFFTEHCIRISR